MWAKKTLHHIIPTSRGWKEERNSDNTIMLNVKIHTWLHTVFWNALPNEQILEIINNPNNNIKDSKKEELYELLGISSFHKIYLPELITDLNKIYNDQLRTWQIINLKKIKKIQELFFRKEKTTEDMILKMFEINKRSLDEEFKNKLLNIIN